MKNRRSTACAFALALALVILPTLAAAGPVAGEVTPTLYTWALDLWQDFTHFLIHDADELGPVFDPNGVMTSGDTDLGPSIDPSGSDTQADPDTGGELGPTFDPNG